MATEILTALFNNSFITKSQIKAINEKYNETKEPIISILLKNGHITERTLLKFFKEKFSINSIDLKSIKINPYILDLISSSIANKFMVFPAFKKGNTLYLAMLNPLNNEALDDISFYTGLKVEPYVVSLNQIEKYLDKYYSLSKNLVSVSTSSEIDTEEKALTEEKDEFWEDDFIKTTGSQAADFVSYIIDDAIERKASDIHLEFIGKRQRVRMRIDGILQEVVEAPVKFSLAIIQRVKILSKMNIAEHFKPQDGRIKWRYKGRDIDLRVSIIPTVLGEKVVMRILDKGSLMVDLKDLGFSEKSRKLFELSLEKPYGIILITGPTGSGKSTTLYSALSKLNEPTKQIVTVEDPVEYNIRGINQIPINSEIGFSFPIALKSILRHSPDIIMLGEIRDRETAEIAIRAALAGQLVLSTIHTNDAPSTVNRLVDMGVKPFLVSASLNLIQAQRLVRKICPKCKISESANIDQLLEMGFKVNKEKKITIFKGKGCSFCNNKGYKGRVAITEVMLISRNLRQLILEGKSSADIKEQAKKEGMLTLREDAWAKVLYGVTTIDEVARETSSL